MLAFVITSEFRKLNLILTSNLKRLTQDDQCGESEPVPETVDVDVDESSVSAIDTTSCMYGEWSGWSACGVTCGWGIKKRNRMVKFRSGSAACEETMQKEICKGSEACERNSDVTACFYSGEHSTKFLLCGV